MKDVAFRPIIRFTRAWVCVSVTSKPVSPERSRHARSGYYTRQFHCHCHDSSVGLPLLSTEPVFRLSRRRLWRTMSGIITSATEGFGTIVKPRGNDHVRQDEDWAFAMDFAVAGQRCAEGQVSNPGPASSGWRGIQASQVASHGKLPLRRRHGRLTVLVSITRDRFGFSSRHRALATKGSIAGG